MVRAADVLLVVELVFPDAHRIDTVDKRREYRDAGIEHYWIVDVAEPITLFIDDQAVTGTFRTETPFPFEINLDRLR
jgi:Uma2 family endonuclease